MRALARTSASLVALAALAAGGRRAVADTVYEFVAVTDKSHAETLVTFRSDAPGTILSKFAMPDLSSPNETEIVAMAPRDGTREVYVLGLSSRLYRVNLDTGAVVWKSNGAGIGFRWANGNAAHLDSARRVIRAVGALDLNLRVDLDTGFAVDGDPATAGLQPDRDLAMADGSQPGAVACGVVAEPGGESTTYVVTGSSLCRLGTKGSAASADAGVLTKIGGFVVPGGPGPSPRMAIAPDGAAFIALQRVNHAGHYLARIDLTTGATSPWGDTPATIIGIDENLYGLCLAPAATAPAPPPDPSPPPVVGDPGDLPVVPPAPYWPGPRVLVARIDRAIFRVEFDRGGRDSATIRGALPIDDHVVAAMPVVVSVADESRTLRLDRRRRAGDRSTQIRFAPRARRGMLAFRLDFSRATLAASVASDADDRLPFVVSVKVGNDKCAANLRLDFVKRNAVRGVARYVR